jgi:hypothetical protein
MFPARFYHIFTWRTSESVLLCQIFTQIECGQKILVKFLNIKFLKSCPVGAELFDPTDMTKPTAAFCSCFVNAPKKIHHMKH